MALARGFRPLVRCAGEVSAPLRVSRRPHRTACSYLVERQQRMMREQAAVVTQPKKELPLGVRIFASSMLLLERPLRGPGLRARTRKIRCTCFGPAHGGEVSAWTLPHAFRPARPMG